MYFFYIDESGEKNPTVRKDEPFVLLALSLYEGQWRKFEDEVNACKRQFISNIYQRTGIRLDLADAEVRSSDIRIPANRNEHPFLKHLTAVELKDLSLLFYDQLEKRNFNLFATVIDKSCLDDYMDIDKLIKKSYELILERAENYLSTDHPKQRAIFVLDNTSKQLNRNLAMKHSYFQLHETTSGLKLKHIIEMPFFVESYLSNGVQLADLCAYNIYRAFLQENEDYEFFAKILPYFYSSKRTRDKKIDGLKVFPDNHKWNDFITKVENKRARLLQRRAQK